MHIVNNYHSGKYIKQWICQLQHWE